MSGIGGIVNYGENAQTATQISDHMLEALKNRGSDIYGTYISEKMCLIHTRNKNFDNTTQPIRTVMGRKAYVLVFDGEIYNKEELRHELSNYGYKFPENNDATVVLHGYMAWGQSCVEKFNGVFAFAIWDDSGLFIARDRLGIRPLYYATGSHGLVFASNIKAILAHPKIEPTVGREGIAELIMLGPGRSPGCAIFKNIKELAPGECAYYTTELKINTYWRLKAKIHPDSFEKTTETVRDLLNDATTRQLAKGGNIASLLSGGLDSSAITALSKVKNTFSVDYVGDNPSEDTDFAEHMVDFLGLSHRNIILGSDELADGLTTAMEARGLPGMADVDSALLLFLGKISENTENFQVVFSGEGADEIFGGYPWYQDEKRLFANTFPWAQNVEYRASFINPDIIKNPEQYIKTCFDNAIRAANTLYDDDNTEKRIRQMYNLNLGWFLQTLASRIDSMSSATKLSVRMPFLDYRLVEYMYNVPWKFKNIGNQEKGLLRQALKEFLPEKILTRKKSPFPKTYNPGYTRRVEDMLKTILDDNNTPLFEIVPKQALTNLLENYNSRTNWYGQLMTYPQTIAYFLQINAWMKSFNVKISN